MVQAAVPKVDFAVGGARGKVHARSRAIAGRRAAAVRTLTCHLPPRQPLQLRHGRPVAALERAEALVRDHDVPVVTAAIAVVAARRRRVRRLPQRHLPVAQAADHQAGIFRVYIKRGDVEWRF